MRLLLIALLCLSNGGCFWGAFFEIDTAVEVNNRTDRTVDAAPLGSLFDDDMFSSQEQSIRSGSSKLFTIDGFEIDPAMEVRYNGIRRVYDVDFGFWGYDEIDVETWHFVNGNG